MIIRWIAKLVKIESEKLGTDIWMAKRIVWMGEISGWYFNEWVGQEYNRYEERRWMVWKDSKLTFTQWNQHIIKLENELRGKIQIYMDNFGISKHHQGLYILLGKYC